jgi:hypothetical protein
MQKYVADRRDMNLGSYEQSYPPILSVEESEWVLV